MNIYTQLQTENLACCPFCKSPAEFKTISGSYGYYSEKIGCGCKTCDIYFYEKTEKYDDIKRKHIYCGKEALEIIIKKWNVTKPLFVYYGAMPESNGKENWTVVLHPQPIFSE